MLLGLIMNKKFEKIVNYFPLWGHSFLPCDRDFGVLKRKLRRHDRLYVPHEISSVIQQAGNRFYIKHVETDEILNFRAWWPTNFKKTCLFSESLGKKTSRDQKVNFQPSLFTKFKDSNEHPGEVKAREFIDGLVQHSFVLARERWSTTSLPDPARAYQGKIHLNVEKINDIRMTLQYIPTEHIPFYTELIAWPTHGEEANRWDVSVDNWDQAE